MWTINCGNCKSIIGYSLVKPNAGVLVFFEETLHKDFKPVEHTKDFLTCENCYGFFPGNLVCFVEDSKEVLNFTQLA